MKMILRHYVNLLENHFRGKDPISAGLGIVLYCTSNTVLYLKYFRTVHYLFLYIEFYWNVLQ